MPAPSTMTRDFLGRPDKEGRAPACPAIRSSELMAVITSELPPIRPRRSRNPRRVSIALIGFSMPPPYTIGRGLFNRPGLRNKELLEQPDGVAVGHPCHEVARRHVEPFFLDGLRIEKLAGPLPDLLPQPGED